MDPLTAAGLASAIITFVDIGTKIASRMKELSEAGDIPEVFRDIRTRLPLIISIISSTQHSADHLSAEARKTFHEVVLRCFEQIHQLDDILQRVVLSKGDSRLRKMVKAGISLIEEERIRRISKMLRDNVQLLTFLNVTPGGDRRPSVQRWTSAAVSVAKDTNGAFVVPFSRDEHFVGRESSLQAIEASFSQQARVAITGIGGVGKSQVAIEYCYRFNLKHPDSQVLWVYGGTIARFYQGYKRIAQRLEIPGWDDPEASILELVSSWLTTSTNSYLLVVDNADNIEQWWPGKYKSHTSLDDPTKNLSKYLPGRSQKGKVLITTRDSRVASRLALEGKPLTLQPMSHQEAKLLFLSKLGGDGSGNDDTDIESLIEELDGLPLAISQAVAFIQENDITVGEYNNALRSKDASVAVEFLDEELSDARRDEESVNSVFRTWNLSYNQIKEQKPAAADLLCLLAMLDRQSIPKFLLKMPEVTTSLNVLQSFNLITSRAGLKSFQLHRLVQKFVQLSIQKENATQKWRDMAVAIVSKEYPTEIGVAEWPVCDSLAPHVHVLTTYEYTREEAQLALAHLLCWAADFDIERGMFTQALERSLRSLLMFRDLVPESDERLAAATWLYGRLRYYQARSANDIDVASDLLHKALEISKYPSPTYADTAFELAHIYFDQCNAEKCLEMGKASYECWKAMRGPYHSRTLDDLQDYAIELAMLGHEEEGVAAWQEIIALCSASDASENTKTIYTYKSMAAIAEFEGDAALAEIFYQKLIMLALELYHPEHMHVYDYRLSHVEQVMLQGNLEEAIQLSKDILESCINNSEWRLQVKCLQTIATCHRLKSEYGKELHLRLRILGLHEKHLREGYKEMADAQDALADCYFNNADYSKATVLHERVLSWRDTSLGPFHIDTIRTIECLGIAYAYQGDHIKAEASYLDALDRQSQERKMSRNRNINNINPSPATVELRLSDNLQLSLRKQGKWEDLESWSRRSCEVTASSATTADEDSGRGDCDQNTDTKSNDSVYRSRAHRNLIIALEGQGKVDEVLEVKTGFMALYDHEADADLSNGHVKEDTEMVLPYAPTVPPVRHQRRFGRIVHPRTWSE